MKNRPEEVKAKTIKTIVACGSIFVTIGYDEQGNPLELFLNGSKLGTCRGNLEALARLTTLLLKNDINIDLIADQLYHIKCTSCLQKIAKSDIEDKNKLPWSCADAVAKILLKHKTRKE